FMENIQEILKAATEYLSLGNVKDAYFAYMNALEVASKELNNIKFVNNVVASKPVSYSSLFTISRTCLSYAEDIIVKHQTAPSSPSSTRKNPNLNIAIYPPTPQQAEHPLDPQNKAPPIPPKPTRRSSRVSDGGSSQTSPKSDQPISPITKPPLPPKPVRRPSMKRHSGEVEVPADGNDVHAVCDDDDSSDSDDDGGYIRGRESFHRRSDPSLNSSHALHRRRSSSPSVPATKRRSTINGSITDSPTDEESPYSSHLTSPATPASFYGALSVPSLPNLFERQKMINVIPEGAVDPNNLVPATILNDDNYQSPNSPSSSQYVDHVPDIPSSPLLTQHAQMEQKIQTLESKLAEYRAVTKMREEGNTENNNGEQPWSELSNEEIKEAIAKYSSTVAGLKQSITRSRKLVYKAASDPDILEFAPHMIAYQLTLIESAIFLEIDPYALLSHSAKNPDPKITASTDFFNYLTRIIERSILLPLEASLRAQIINHWVKVAGKLHELHNFQTLKAVLSALGTTPIKRLKRTWACIPKKSMAKLDALNEMMSEARNYGKYREMIQRDGFLRKPTIPFLGTFIMDATYLLAAVKYSSNSSAPLSNNVQSPVASRSVSSPTGIHDDPRVQEMLQTMHRYQNGPKYYSSPPSSYIKASTKHHFRTASISAALHRSGVNKYYNRNDDEDEMIEEKQQLITHYLLTRVWVPQKSVDELSSLREPHKNSYSANNRAPGAASWSGPPSSTVSNTNGAQRGSTGSTVGGSGTSTNTSSGVGRTSSTSGSGESRPHSLEEVVDTVPTVSVTSKSDRAGPISDKESGSIKEKRNITEKVGSIGSFLFGSRSSLDKARDEKEKEEKNKNGDVDTDSLYDDCSEELVRSHSEQTSNKRASWRAMRVMFGGHEIGDSLKSPTAMIRSSSHSRSSSSGELNPKNHSATFIKAHGRTSSANPKPITSRRSLEEPRSSTPPPLLPKPPTLMQRSSSASSANSMGSSATANISGKRSSTGNSTIPLGGGDIENIRMVIAKKVANEVAAGGVALERNWQ
ncbi:14091_t:CDS:2, partial [Racocetra persica]